MKKIIVVMGGSFNPPTMAHLRLMQAAVEQMHADRGIFVPSDHTYVKIKMRRAKHPDEVLSEEMRLQMLQRMAAEDARLEADDLEYRRKERGYTFETMEAVQEKYPDAQLYFLAGGDKVQIIPRWHRIREFLERFCIIVMRRDGEDPETALMENEFLRAHRDRFCILDAPDGIEGISSTAVRDLRRTGENGWQKMLHPGVYELMKKNGDA